MYKKSATRRITKSVNGWRLKICYPKELQTPDSPDYIVHRFFSFTKYGGSRAALKAAQAARDEAEYLYGLKQKLWLNITGVTLHVRDMPDRNQLYCCWRASWRQWVNGERKNRSKQFSFKPDDNVSEKIAREKAIAFRKKMEKLHY